MSYIDPCFVSALDLNQLLSDASYLPITGRLEGRSDVRSTDSNTISSTFPPVDWKETPDAHVFKAELPGVKKEAVKLAVVDGPILEVSGERRKEEEVVKKYHRAERFTGKFLRRFRLPENAKVDEAKASMENGMLTITVPKHSQPQIEPHDHQPQPDPKLDPLIREYVVVDL